MPANFISAAVAALSLSSFASASYVPYARREANYNGTASYSSGTGSAATTGTAGKSPTYQNGTSVTATPNSLGSNSTFTTYEDLICPLYNDEVLLISPTSQWLIECATTAQGAVLAVRKTKRQSTAAEWLVDCVYQCQDLTGCVGTGYNIEQSTCTFYSSVDATYPDTDVDFAIIVTPDSAAASSAVGTVAATSLAAAASAAQLTTSTVYSTRVQTISSCAPTISDCPLRTVTDVISLYTTVCPASEVSATATVAAAVCTACSYTTSVATVISWSTSGSVTQFVPVTTQAVVVPILAATPQVTVTDVVSQTTTFCPESSATASGASQTAGSNASGSSAVANYPVPATTAAAVNNSTGLSNSTTASNPTNSIVMYTGAANKNAGMGLAAAIAGAAALIL